MAITAQDLLARLNKVQPAGKGGWKAQCPAHGDTTGSLTITERDGKILLHCFAGCDTNKICGALGLELKDLFLENTTSAGSRRRFGCTLDEYAESKCLDKSKLGSYFVTDETRKSKYGSEYPVVRISYRDKAGTETAVRYRQNLLKGDGPNGEDRRFCWADGSKLSLYGQWRLPQDKNAPLIIVEGESDTHTLWQADFNGVGLPGAAAWDDVRDADVLADFNSLYLVLEPDDGGYNLWEAFAGNKETGKPTSRIASKIKVCVLGRGPTKDANGLYLSDKAHFREKLLAALSAATPLLSFKAPKKWQKKPDGRAKTSAKNGQAGGRPPTGYAQLADEFLATKHRDKDGFLLLRHHRGTWWHYSAKRNCYEEWLNEDVEADVMGFLRRHHSGSASGNALHNIILNLRSTDLCAIPSTINPPCWLDTGAPAVGWIAFRNQLINLDALTDPASATKPQDAIRKPTPKLFSLYGIDYDYMPAATAPQWAAYLTGVQPKQADQEMLAMLAGLLLIPKSYTCAWFLFGDGGTGKSVFLHVIVHLIGKENTCCVPMARFADRFDLVPITYSLANIVGDMPTASEHVSISDVEGTFKDICDGNTISVQRKFKDQFTAPALARLIFATNSLPHFTDRSNGTWDRLRIVGFNQRFRGASTEDRDLRYRLVREELPGILNWAIIGLTKLKRDHPHQFPEHSVGLLEKSRLRTNCDPERVFLNDAYTLGGPDSYVETDKVYQDYRSWCQSNGYKSKNAGNFAESVRRIFGCQKHRTRLPNGDQRTVYMGLQPNDLPDPSSLA